ncbi:MAG: phosphotransferase [Actinomycetota bacterium]|nr:phosphotransferase [Actinomycetota bacterium]
MPEHLQSPTDELQRLLDGEPLRDWLQQQRWYASKSRSVSAIELAETVALHDDPALVIVLAQARFATGTHELYQLPLGIRGAGEAAVPAPPILEADGWTVFDALQDSRLALELLRRIDSCDDQETPEGRFSFRRVEDSANLDEHADVRAMGVEQSNSSIVFDNRLVLKAFRKLEAGINPELELLRFLTARQFPNIAPLHGWYEYDGHSLAATLGVVQEFLPDAVDGWALALEEILSNPEQFLDRIGRLGAATAQMHTALASDPGDPAFSPEDPSNEAISLLTATIDEDIERIFLRLPDDERLAPINGRGQEVRERLAARAHIGIGGKHIRIHGDYHLGQTLQTPRDWVILDFEGEPARPLSERRQKRSPLRDVASMLRSFAYTTSAVQLQRGGQAPADFERRARDRFLERYFAEIDSTLLPAGQAAIANMLAIFELEKAIYELRYELDNRPDWVSIPVDGIARILESA